MDIEHPMKSPQIVERSHCSFSQIRSYMNHLCNSVNSSTTDLSKTMQKQRLNLRRFDCLLRR